MTNVIKVKMQPSVPKYPKMMRSKNIEGLIVLFYSFQCGTVVTEQPVHDLGSYFTNWNMGCFEPFTGVVELS